MSRRRRRDSQNTDLQPPQREHFLTPYRSLTPTLLRETAQAALRRMVEDRRTYHPERAFRPARLVTGQPVGPVRVSPQKQNKSRPFLAHGLSFEAPKRTMICVRRKERKEVLHALKKVGRGSGRGRKRRNWYSNIGC